MMNAESILKKVADHVFIITHTNYSARRENIEREMCNLRASSYEFVIQYPNPFDSTFLKKNNRTANIWMGHYRALKIGYELGYEKFMILEDDIGFIKDTEKLESSFSEVSSGFDFLHLDPVAVDLTLYSNGIHAGNDRGFKNWGIYDGLAGNWIHSTGGYCLSHATADLLIKIYEQSVRRKPDGNNCVVPADMMYGNLVDSSRIQFLYAVPNICIQKDMGTGQRGKYTEFALNAYKKMNIDMTKY